MFSRGVCPASGTGTGISSDDRGDDDANGRVSNLHLNKLSHFTNYSAAVVEKIQSTTKSRPL